MNISDIIKAAYLKESSAMARRYFKKSGLDYRELHLRDFNVLRDLIQAKIYSYADNKYFEMIPCLDMDCRVTRDKDLVLLTVSSGYFKQREAITFNGEWIGFCRDMRGCNRIPFIIGFLNWIPYVQMAVNKKNNCS